MVMVVVVCVVARPRLSGGVRAGGVGGDCGGLDIGGGDE